MKIRTRFTLLFAMIVGIILFFFSFSIYYISETNRQNDFHERLKERAISKLKILSVTHDNKDNNILDNNSKVNHLLNTFSNENIAIFDSNGTLLYHETNKKIPPSEIIRFIQNNSHYSSSNKVEESTGFQYFYRGHNYILFSSASDIYGIKYINNLKKILVVRGIILLLIIFICGWLYAGYFLKPISDIVQQTSTISYNNLNQRLNARKADDEIGQLTTTINKMLARLEIAVTVQKRFVSNASHEIRNPLAAISGQIEVALLRERTKEEYKVILETIIKDIKNLIHLSNNLLELANTESENQQKHFRSIRIDELLWQIRDTLLKKNPECKLHIHYEKIIDNENFLTCKGDENLLKIAFINIIDNAFKFSNEKKICISINFDNTNIILRFVDTGIGIPDSYLKHVYEPFYRGSNTSGIAGHGIGLSLVQRIVKLHYGKISIHSKQNEGTTVELTFQNLSSF